MQPKTNSGFTYLLLLLGIGAAIGITILLSQSIKHQSPTQTKETPRLVVTDYPAPTTNINGNLSPTLTTTQPTTTISSAPVNEKKTLRINSNGNVDLGGGFTANLTSAYSYSYTNLLYVEVLLRNGYSSFLGLNTNEFTLRGNNVVTKPKSRDDIGIDPGKTKSITLVFNKLPGSEWEISYDHPDYHIVFKLGTLSDK